MAAAGGRYGHIAVVVLWLKGVGVFYVGPGVASALPE